MTARAVRAYSPQKAQRELEDLQLVLKLMDMLGQKVFLLLND